MALSQSGIATGQQLGSPSATSLFPCPWDMMSVAGPICAHTAALNCGRRENKVQLMLLQRSCKQPERVVPLLRPRTAQHLADSLLPPSPTAEAGGDPEVVELCNNGFAAEGLTEGLTGQGFNSRLIKSLSLNLDKI
jgi:hypothetical protein